MDLKINWVNKLVEVMKELRGPDGCPWDKAQTFESLRPCIIEECAELVDSISDSDTEGIKEELGDVLMNVVLHAQIADEQGLFNLHDVAEGICEKMIRRHPHVFGDKLVDSIDAVSEVWEEIKSQEKPDRFESVIDGVPRSLPPLIKAIQVQKKAAKVGFEWGKQEEVLDKIEEELDEVRDAIEHGDEAHIDEEIGDLLFAVACLTRFRKGKTADVLLNEATKKFTNRFKYMESHLREDHSSFSDMTQIEMKKLWAEAKKGLEK